jgi:hypothetical protein
VLSIVCSTKKTTSFILYVMRKHADMGQRHDMQPAQPERDPEAIARSAAEARDARMEADVSMGEFQAETSEAKLFQMTFGRVAEAACQCAVEEATGAGELEDVIVGIQETADVTEAPRETSAVEDMWTARVSARMEAADARAAA